MTGTPTFRSANHAGQCAFHSGANNNHAAPASTFHDSPANDECLGHAYVIKMLNLVAHDLRSDHSLFRNRNVAGARRNHSDNSLAIFLFVPLQNDCPRQFMVLSPAHFLFDCGELLLSWPASQEGYRGAGVLPCPNITSGMPTRNAR